MKEDRRAKLAEVFTDVSTVYNEIVTEFPEFGSVKMAQTLEEEEKYFSSAQGFYKIAVVGSYSTGKTTLLKALFFDRGLYEIDLPTAADITTQVPTIIKLIPGYTESCYVHAEPISKEDFVDALRWMLDQITRRISVERPDFSNITPTAFGNWVKDVAIPTLKQPVRGGSSATNEHYIKELEEAVQIFRTLDPGYKFPAINSINTALAAIKDSKASRTLRSISISIPARNITYPVQLVDLPGMDVPNLAHRQFSYKFIAEEADAVLFLKDAQKPSFTEGEQELLTHIASKLYDIQQKCFFIFNKWHDSDHPGAEKAVREVINNYHFQSKNIFRVSALPALMAFEEKEGINIDDKYKKNQQDWAVSSYRELKQQFGSKLMEEMGIVQLREFLEYYCENSLPMLALKNHTETVNDVLKAMNKKLEEIAENLQEGKTDVTSYENPTLAKCEVALETFKENVHGIETRLDEFADSLQESLVKLIGITQGKVMVFEELEPPKGKLAKLLHKIGFRKRKPTIEIRLSEKSGLATKESGRFAVDKKEAGKGSPKESKKMSKRTPKELDVPGTEETVIFDDEPDLMAEEAVDGLVPQRPIDIMTFLIKDVFPTIDVYQRVRVIRNYTAGRSKVHSHEVELAVIRDVNKMLREKFLEILVSIVSHHIEVFCRTIDNEGYIDHIDQLLTQLNLNLYIQPHNLFIAFMDRLKGRLHEACEVMAEMAIKKLDEVGVYNNELNEVAALTCENQEESKEKQKSLLAYLDRNYKKHLAIAFQTLSDEGWDELSQKIAKGREDLVGLLGKHDVIASKIFDERKAMDRRGKTYELALFERMEQALREKLAVLKDVAKEEMGVKATQRNAKIAVHQQKIQVMSHQCSELLSLAAGT